LNLELTIIWNAREIEARGSLESMCHLPLHPSTFSRLSPSPPFLLSERYESELSLRQLVENDITGLRGILGELTLCKSDLEAHVESMKDDLICLKKGHEEVSEVAAGPKTTGRALLRDLICIN
jgi:hypothetical protein